MDKFLAVAAVWDWLPAFRAVAEFNHLPTASRQLHVSPSALSRTIHLLEDRFGKPLFDRVGRQIRLNRSGEMLAAAVREAMRRVDDGLERAGGAMPPAVLRVSAVGVTKAF